MKGPVLLLFTSFFFLFSAQENDWGFGLKYKNGFLIAHRSIMSHIPESHTNALEASVFFQTRGKKDWHRAYGYPTIGLSALITSAGNKDILGTFGGIFSFTQFRLLNKEKNKIILKIGAGVGFTNKIYDPLLNPKNVAISSHANALINLALFYQYEYKKNQFSFGLDMTHFSNGAGKLPNLGINLPYYTLGYSRKMRESDLMEQVKNKVNSDWKFTAIAIASMRDSYPTGGEKYPVYALSLSGQKAFRFGLGYETGFDLIYKPSLEKYKPVIPKSTESIIQFGWYNGYFVSFEHLQIHLGMGIYLRDEYFADDKLYHRFGFKYSFDSGLLLNVTLKSHWAKADYVEWGIGYRF